MIRYSVRAESEIEAIAEHYPESYLASLQAQIERAAAVRGVAKRVRNRPHVWRVLHASDFVYLRHEGGDMLVLRVTHTRREREHL